MDQITVVFDMEGAGLKNIDMVYTQYIINLFKLQYPNSLNYIIIYDMAWILTATFKIIKSLLPPKAVERMKFVNSKSMSEFIPEENMLRCWGSKSDYVFNFFPQDPSVKILDRDPEDAVDNHVDPPNDAVASAVNGNKKVIYIYLI